MGVFVQTIAEESPHRFDQRFAVGCPFRGFLDWLSVVVLTAGHALIHGLYFEQGVPVNLWPRLYAV